MREGPIILIDDDHDDLELIKEALDTLGVKNKIIAFTRADEALKFFNEAKEYPFLVFCDINMPKTNGLELREKINTNPLLSLKTVPFIFLTTASDNYSINDAYKLSIQGYFVKPRSVIEIQALLASIIAYWRISHEPHKN